MFDGLKENEIENILSVLGPTVIKKKDEELYRNGYLAIIVSGKATIKRLNDIGDCITIRTISEGEMFGIASVFGDWKNGMSSILADTTCKVIYFSENTFTDIINRYPKVSINYIQYLSNKIRFLNRKLDAFTAKSTEERLYEFLLSQSDADGNVNLKFGIAELARRINVGRTSIYRDIETLQSKKLILRNGHNFKIIK